MKRYAIYLDEKRCIACFACEVHCKTNKGLPVGPSLCEESIEPFLKVKGIPKTFFRFRSCHHCEDPHCVAVCPTGAMQKREKDGIVFVDQEKCVGCMLCAVACPWNIPEYNPATGKAVKCDYCMDRVDQGLEPACVTKCTTHALQFVELSPISFKDEFVQGGLYEE